MLAPASVLRVFLRSAKGAARATNGVRNMFAPRSVLRVFLKSQGLHEVSRVMVAMLPGFVHVVYIIKYLTTIR